MAMPELSGWMSEPLWFGIIATVCFQICVGHRLPCVRNATNRGHLSLIELQQRGDGVDMAEEMSIGWQQMWGR